MMINPLWYEVQTSNDVVVTGKDVWSIVPGTLELPAGNRVWPVPDDIRRPRS
jgi:hypothetical protein